MTPVSRQPPPPPPIDCFAHVDSNASVKATPLVISHFGASGDYPRCTDISYTTAISDGADVIGCPVQMSKDGVPFCLSSANLMNSTTVTQTEFRNLLTTVIEAQPNEGIFSFSLSWTDIQSLKPVITSPGAGSLLFRSPKFRNAGKLISLADFLDLAKNASSLSGVLIKIEESLQALLPHLALEAFRWSLLEKGTDIWDEFTSRNHIDSIGLTDLEEGDLGPVHGFPWRHFGASYTGMHADYTGQGIDQLSDVIHKIKNSPDDRRIILSSWNPSDLTKTALPLSHMFAQFYVANGELSCLMYQPSADMGHRVPFDIAFYALLTCLIAHVCDLIPGDFIHDIGVAHVDRNHFESFQEQLRIMPKPFPVLKINSQKKSIDSFVSADFNLIGYHPHEQIELKMAV